MATKAQRPNVQIGSTIELTKGQYKGRTGTVQGITEPVEANGFLYLVVVDLPEGTKESTWTYAGRTQTQRFLVPAREGIRVMPNSFTVVDEAAE